MSSAAVFNIISAAVGILGLTSIVIAWLQLRDSTRWNRRNAAFTYFPSAPELSDVEKGLEDVVRFFTRPQTQPLTDLEAKALHGAELTAEEIQLLKRASDLHVPDSELAFRFRDAGRHLKHYLSVLERYSLAINSGVVDRGVANRLFHSKFLTHFTKAEAYIRYAQRKADGAYRELEEVVNTWSRRRLSNGAA